MNVELPTGAADFTRMFMDSIGQGVAEVSTVEGVPSGLVLAAVVTVLTGLVAAWSSGFGTDELAPILREDER